MDPEYDMLYCDDIRCRVNTFERGNGGGLCPACEKPGYDLPTERRYG